MAAPKGTAGTYDPPDSLNPEYSSACDTAPPHRYSPNPHNPATLSIDTKRTRTRAGPITDYRLPVVQYQAMRTHTLHGGSEHTTYLRWYWVCLDIDTRRIEGSRHDSNTNSNLFIQPNGKLSR